MPFSLGDQGSEHITLLGETFVILIGELEEGFRVDLGDQIVSCVLELRDLLGSFATSLDLFRELLFERSNLLAKRDVLRSKIVLLGMEEIAKLNEFFHGSSTGGLRGDHPFVHLFRGEPLVVGHGLWTLELAINGIDPGETLLDFELQRFAHFVLEAHWTTQISFAA